MSNIRKKVTILEVEERTSKKSGNKYRVAQCVVHGENKRVGELMIFNKDIEAKEGDFLAEFDVTVNFERMVTAELMRLIPFVEGRTAAPASAKA
jgi:hypothetical protein